MKSKVMIALVVFAIGSLASNASAQCWFDNFDSYAVGSGLIGQGGWEGWDGGQGTNAYVSNFVSHSAPHSVRITPTSDVIQQFSGYSSGLVTVAAWQYIPSGSTGDQYFILLDSYAHGGPYHWAIQIRFGGGVVESEFDALTLPLAYDQWVEFLVLIDMDADDMAVYYGGNLLVQKPWTYGTNNDGSGIPNLACMDLFSNGGSDIYYDDISVTMPVTPVQDATWGQIKSLF